MSKIVFAQIFPPFTLCKKWKGSLKILLKGGSPAIEQISAGPRPPLRQGEGGLYTPRRMLVAHAQRS
jgi:hypothetical protein